MEKRSREKDREGKDLACHYVAKKDTLLSRITGVCDANVSTLRLGMLVEANEVHADGGLRIRVNDTNNDSVWCQTQWRCHKIDLIQVPTLVWQFLAAVDSPQERVRLASNSDLCQNAKNLRAGDRIWYRSQPNAQRCLAVIKFIGPVMELGQGFHFGLELLDNLVPSKNYALAKKYMASSSGNLTLATLSEVSPLEHELADQVKNSDLSNNVKSTSLQNPTLPKDFETPSNSSTSTNHVSNGKRTMREMSSAFEERLSLFDDRNNNGDALSRLNNALIPKVAHQSAKSKVVVSDSSALTSRNQESLDFLDDLLEKHGSNDVAKKEQDFGDVGIGSAVEVRLGPETRFGVIRWIGTPPGITPGRTMAAIELEDGQHHLGTDGTFNDIRYFRCDPRRAVFTDLKDCQQFNMIPADDHLYKLNGEDCETADNCVVKGIVRPISVKGDLEKICGKYRGIQGHHNSCYLDATLFSMFAFTSVFDNLLFRPPNEKDHPQYEQVQRVLREEIVNPLRKNKFVKANRVMELRKLLEKLSSVSGLTSEEKDPEEFLTSLVAQILKAEPFLKLSSGQDAYHYQLFVEKDDHLSFPTVQQLLEQSFLTSNIRLKEVPSCLIIQMPRFGKSFKMYQKILPTLLLDVTDIIEDSPRQCIVCGKLAEFECKECYGECGKGLESISFCMVCLEKAHRHERRTSHTPKMLEIPTEFIALQEHCTVPRLYLELSAVVCIETSHYVSFVKCGSGSGAPWCFFDSMADRIGEQNGYNIPEMVPCPSFAYWLGEEGANSLPELSDDRMLPEPAKRLFRDAYMCMYQSPDVMMYK